MVRAAADLVNAEGAQALSINRLARQLGVQPPSIYNHVQNLDDLWRQIAILSTQALGERITAAALGQSGAQGLRQIAQAYRSYILEFPGLYLSSLRASGSQENPDPELQAAEERVVRVPLALVNSFGLTGEDAIHAVRAFRSLVHGFATLELAGGFGLPVDTDESFHRLVEWLILGIEQRSFSPGQPLSAP